MRAPRWLRRTLKILGALALAPLLILLIAFGLLQTRWGKDLVARQTESILGGILTGGVRIGAIEGFLPTHLVLREVVLYDAHRREAITAERVAVDLSLWPLLQRRLEVARVVVEAPVVLLITEGAEVNLAHLVRPTPPAPPTPPSDAAPWTIDATRIQIEDAEFRLRTDSSSLAVDRIQIVAHGLLVGTELSFVLERLSARLDRPRLDAVVSGRLHLRGDALEIDQVAATVDGTTHLEGGTLSLGLADGRLQAALEAIMDPAAVGARLGLPALTVGARLRARLDHRGAGKNWRAHLAGTLGGGPFTASATAAEDFGSLAVTLGLPAIHPSQLHPRAPEGDLGLALSANIDDLRPKTLRGTLALQVSGAVTPLPALGRRPIRLDLTASAEAGAIDVGLRARSDRSTLQGGGRVVVEPFALRDTELRLWAPDLGALLFGLAPLDGTLSATVSADGPLDGLTARVAATAGVLELGGWKLKRVVVEARGALEAPGALINVPHLEAELGRTTYRVQVPALRLPVGGGLTLEGATIESSAGHAELAGRLSTWSLEDAGWVKLRAEDVVLGQLTEDLGLPSLRGQGAAQLAVEFGPAPTLALDAQLDGLEGNSAVHAQAQLQLLKGTITASVSVATGPDGRVVLSAVGRAPDPVYQVEAWQRLGWGAVRAIDGELQRVDLSILPTMLPLPIGVEGRVGGTIHAGPGLAEGRVRLQGIELRYPGLPGPISSRLEAGFDRQQTSASLVAAVGDQPMAAVTVALAAGSSAWLRAPQATLLEADGVVKLEVDAFPIALLSELWLVDPSVRSLPRTDQLAGEISLHGQLRRRARGLKGQVQLSVMEAVWLKDAPAVTASVAATLAGRKMELRGEVAAGAVGRVELTASGLAPVEIQSPEAWSQLGIEALQALHLVTDTVDLEVVDRLSGRRLPARGTLTAELRSTAGLRSVEAHLAGRDLGRRGLAPLGDAEVYLDAGPQSTLLDLGLFQAGRPVLTASVTAALGTGDLGSLAARYRGAPIRGRASLDELSLEKLTRTLGLGTALHGTLSATAAIAGTIEHYRGQLHLDAGKAEVRDQRFSRFLVDADLDPRQLNATARADAQDGGKLVFDAHLGLQGDQAPVEAHLRSEALRLDFLSAFLQGQSAVGGISGILDSRVDLTGTRAQPQVQGKAEIKDFAVVLAPPAPALDRTQIAASFDNDGLVITADGRSGNGTVKAKVDVKLEAIDRGTAEVHLETKELPFTAGPRQAMIDSRIAIKATFDQALNLDVAIEEASVDIPNQGTDQLKVINSFEDVVYTDEARREAVLGSTVAVASLPVSIKIASAQEIPVRGREIEAVAKVNLGFQSQGGPLEGSGKVVVKDGWVVLFGRRWQIQVAELAFHGPPPPQINIEITRDLGTAIATVRVTGTPNAPELSLSSDPPIYDESQLLFFLLGADPGSESNATLQSRATGAAAGALAGMVQSRLEDVLPLDTLNVEIGDGAAISRVSVGKWITQRIFVGYDYIFDADEDQNASEGVLQIRLGRGWMLESRYGDRGVGGLDFIWVRRF